MHNIVLIKLPFVGGVIIVFCSPRLLPFFQIKPSFPWSGIFLIDSHRPYEHAQDMTGAACAVRRVTLMILFFHMDLVRVQGLPICQQGC